MQMCTRLCKLADGSAHMHEPGVSVQSAVFICKAVCLCAAPHFHLQKRVHMFPAPLHTCMSPVCLCKAPCLFAKPFAYVQQCMFICRSACICARPSVPLQAS